MLSQTISAPAILHVQTAAIRRLSGAVARVCSAAIGFISRIVPAVVSRVLATPGIAVRSIDTGRPGISMKFPSVQPNANTSKQPAVALTGVEQWSKLTDILTTAIARADDACRRQVAATQQLDLAQYGLSTLADELAAVMTVPGRRDRAAVYRFEVSTPRSTDQALAA